MVMKHYRIGDRYIGGTDGDLPEGAVEVHAPPEDSRQEWTGSGWGPAAPTVGAPRLIATGVFAIDEGMMSGMETAVGISAAFPMGPGSYWIFFTETQPNLAYSYNVSASSGQINVTTRDTSFIEVTATDGGVPTDPVEISIQVARVQ